MINLYWNRKEKNPCVFLRDAKMIQGTERLKDKVSNLGVLTKYRPTLCEITPSAANNKKKI